jgi:hypothetical protein
MICGCGGGFDIYTGLPIYHYLKPRTEAIFLGNLSFASLPSDCGRRRTVAVTEIDADTEGSPEYFPEKVLAEWFRGRGEEVSIFCFQRTGVTTLMQAWKALQQELRFEAVVLVDGGTDSLMRGDETRLGTPQEDMANIAAVHALKLQCKVLTCLGFGVDTFDGVCHAHFLESVAALQKKGAFLGAFSLLPEMEEAQFYVDAVNYSVKALPGSPSVVNNSIASAIEGDFGDHHRTWRTAGNKLFISPLMSMFWSFDLDAVAKRCLYLKELMGTRSFSDVESAIRKFQEEYPPTRAWSDIPY